MTTRNHAAPRAPDPVEWDRMKPITEYISISKIITGILLAVIFASAGWSSGYIERWNHAAVVAVGIDERIHAAIATVEQAAHDEMASELETLISDGLTDYDDAFDEFTDWKKQSWNEMNKGRVRDGLEPIAEP